MSPIFITIACLLFAAFIITFAIGTRYAEEDIGPTHDTYHDHMYEGDEDANS